MKYIVILLVLLLSQFYQYKCSQNNHNQLNIHQLQTPKGLSLKDHFGVSPVSNSYGPKPSLVTHDLLFQSAERGQITKKTIRQLINGDLSNNKQDCDITRKDWYSACLTLQGCDICISSVHCRWCESRQTCYPETVAGQACPNNCQTLQSCSGSVKSGHLGHWPTSMTRVKTVEYTYPKYKLDTTFTSPQVLRTPLLLGHIDTSSNVEKRTSSNNQVISQNKQSVITPIYGEVHQIVNLDLHSTQYIDSHSGQRVDEWLPHNIQYHGVDDDILMNNDIPIKRQMDINKMFPSKEQQALQQQYASSQLNA